MDQATTIKRNISPMLYVLSLLGGNGTRHRVFKLLYFADRDHLSKFGRTITGDTYIAMKDGPVPSNLYNFVKKVGGEYTFPVDPNEIEILGQYFTLAGEAMIIAKAKADNDFLSKSEINSLEFSFAKHGTQTWKERRDDSHGPAWHSTSRNGKITEVEIAKEAGASKGLLHYITSMK